MLIVVSAHWQEFVESYLKVGRPIILTDAARHWTALRWTPDTLMRDYGDVTFRLNWGAWSEEHKKIKRIYMTMKVRAVCLILCCLLDFLCCD